MGILDRIYHDYGMPGRWREYRAFLAAAKTNGYTFLRHQDARAAFAAGDQKLLFLRHDIDTDLPIARKMHAIEREMGVRGTYYFRRCTMDLPLMREIIASGSEVGYHYEEISDHIKAFGIRDRALVFPALDGIREVFLHNLKVFEDEMGIKVRTVAAHGDFSNRYLGLFNTELMTESVRTAGGIDLEAYDEFLVGKLSFRAADQVYPHLWQPSDPIKAMEAGTPVMLLLIHPRHWQRAPIRRFHLDLDRLLQEIHYRLR